MSACVFCDIIAHQSPASVIVDDDAIMAFMTIHPSAPGECVVIPKVHVDHFTDLEDAIAQRIMLAAMHIGRGMRRVFAPQRVGFVVHGYGVAHAHLIVVPQNGPDHITSGHFARIENGQIVFTTRHIPLAERAVLDEHARQLRESSGIGRAG